MRLTLYRERLVSLGWWITVVGLIVLPSLTRAEKIEFSLAGTPLQLRFVAYALLAVVVGGLALGIVLSGLRIPRYLTWAAAAFGIWYLLTTAIAGQAPREWLPSTLRWLLYGGAAVVGVTGAQRMSDLAMRRYWLVLGLSLLVPILAGVAELITGSARILNNAPRITGTMTGHPVAYSLLLDIGVVILVPLAISVSGRLAGLLWLAIALLFGGVLFTFTRASIAAVPLASAVAVLLAQQANRPRVRTACVAAVAVVLVGLVSVPFIQARAADEPPMQIELPPSSGAPTGSPDTPHTPPSNIPFLIDNSTGLRLQTHLWGLSYIVASPITGHGPGSFDRLFARDTGKLGVAAHDDFLLMAVETGLPGLALFIALYGSVLFAVWSRLRGSADPRRRAFFAGVGVAFALVNIGLAIHNPTYFPEIQVPLWLGIGIAVGLHQGRAAADERHAGDPAR